MGKTVTSLKIDEDTYKRFKIRCVKLDLEYSDGLQKAMEKWLGKNG